MTNSYDIGDKPRLRSTFKVETTETDPTAVALVVKTPDGVSRSYLSASGFTGQGNWDASTNTPTLANGIGSAGYYYDVTVAGSIDFGDGSQTFAIGDRVAYDGESWVLIPAPESATLTNDAVGVYDYFLPVHQIGLYVYRFEGFGTVHAAAEERFKVTKSNIR